MSRYAAPRPRMQWAIGLLVLLCAFVAVARPAGVQAPRTVLVMGDSLSAGYGMAASQGWVSLLDDRLEARRPGWNVVNASISGETTAGGVARIDAALARTKPAVVVIALGANDGLRGLPLAQTRANLGKMVAASRKVGAEVLLVGMRMPPNLGRDYTEGFEANYRTVAKEDGATLLPFLLAPIAADRDAFQADNLHPTADVQPQLLDHVWKTLEPML